MNPSDPTTILTVLNFVLCRYVQILLVACGAGMKRDSGMVGRIHLKRLSRIRLQRCMVKLKEMKQGAKLNNKQQNSSKANITISASVSSSIRGLQMAPTQLGAKPSAVSVKNWANTSANLQQLNSNYQVKQPKNDITKRDNTITTSSLLIRKLRKMRYWKYVNTDWLHQDNHGK